MVPERSIVGKSAKSVFFEEFNEIDIYIEDTARGYQKLYEKIFSRVFSGKFKLDRVFPLGDRASVIDLHSASIGEVERPTLFVIDGDFFIAGFNDDQCERGLYCLPFYCIENLLIDRDAWLKILDEEEDVRSYDEVAEDFDFEGWEVRNRKYLYDLFIEYTICYWLFPDKATSAFPVNQLVSSDQGEVDPRKIEEKISEVREVVVNNVGIDSYNRAKSSVMKNIEDKGVNYFDIVSGKTYLFPLLKTRLRSTVKTRAPDINIKQRLAALCSISKISECVGYVAGNEA